MSTNNTGFQLRKATRKQVKLRLGLSAVSGGGKTKSALLLAKGLVGDWSKIAVIDTENGSAELYSNLGDYNVLPMSPPFSPERYIQAIQTCENAGMECIIIDSISHEWEGKGGILDQADQMGGQFQTAWKKLTPLHEQFKQAILQSKCHIITTVRRKQEFLLEDGVNKQGKAIQKPVKAGMKEITKDGWEYELTINLELDINHFATASKDRTGMFMDTTPFIITEATGELIKAWCEQGIDLEKVKQVIEACTTTDEVLALKEQFELEFQQPEIKALANTKYKILKQNEQPEPVQN